jgi:hypothetical protein
MSVYIPEFNSPSEFVGWFIDLFDTSYGTTSFFATPEEAKNFVDEYLIKPNISLSPYEVGVLLFWSEESLAYAHNWLWTSNNPSQKKAAVIYWNLMADYIELYSYDPDMIAVVNQGAQAAEDTESLTFDEDVKPKVSIPLWVLAIPFFFLFFKRR